MRKFPILMAVSLAGFIASPAMAGSLGATKVSPDLPWTSDCDQPVAPAPSFHDIEGYNQSLAAYNSYVAQVRVFIQCVQADGAADIDALAAAVSSAMQAQQNAAVATAEELRTQLEVQRSLLR